MNKQVEQKLANLSKMPGVYLFRDSTGKVLYVGKAKNLRNRVRSYFQSGKNLDPKTQVMVDKIRDLETIIVDNELEALVLESNLIKKYKPRYNVNLRDDKSYPYIRITNEPFPRIFVTRKIVRDGSKYLGPYTDVKNLRFIIKAVRKIFPVRSCKYYLDDDVITAKKVKVCLDYHIKRCQGPCEGLVSEQEYQRMIRRVEQFLKGKTRNLLQELTEEMTEESKRLHFEIAARLRDQIRMIENYYFTAPKVVIHDFEDRDVIALAQEAEDACAVVFKIRDGKIVGRQHFYLTGVEDKPETETLEKFLQQYYLENDFTANQVFLPFELGSSQKLLSDWMSRRAGHKIELLVPQIGEKKKLIGLTQKNARYLLDELLLQKLKRKEGAAYNVRMLQKDLKLESPPRRIEAFDISNFQGKNAVASMVCFINGKPHKSDYRHFKIRSKETPDDFAMMREAVFRRYKRVLEEKKPLPDLILVDGGKGQLSSALKVLRSLGLDQQPVIGLAKRLEEVFLPGHSEPQNIPKRSAGLKLLQHIRDESHRFAITYHRKLRQKQTLKSPLDDVPGIGPRRKEHLLRTFGSLKKIREAKTEDLISRGKLPAALAERLKKYLGG
ncbi:excinuclease ABC subunit C [candidate division KSB1 bacterium 4484_188]|nr:MAG: excinuclease ABC subunit C [candidate division KSB1 bacterium 4484_188]